MAEPAGGVTAARVSVGPVDKAAAVIVDELAAELHDVAGLEAVQSRCQTRVVRHEQRTPVIESEQETLVRSALIVIWQKPVDLAKAVVGPFRDRARFAVVSRLHGG